MAFASLQFVIFLLAVCAVYFITPIKARWAVLLVASYAFYLLSSPNTLIFMVVTTVATFLAGRAMGKIQDRYQKRIDEAKEKKDRETQKKLKSESKAATKRIVVGILLLNFGILATLKYFWYYLETILTNAGIEVPFDAGILIPLGISFYTFQSAAYILDIYRNKIRPDKNLAKLALFFSFFPIIIQGPISRYDQLAHQLYAGHTFDYQRIAFGAQLMIWGMFKKLVVADRIGALVDTVFDNPGQYEGFTVIIAVICYTIQIYADFSGGIDIARGAAQTLGITLEDNFKRPYFSDSVSEFWRRWHITLGNWCKDYIFFTVSLSPTFGKLGKKSRKYLGDRVGKLMPVIIAQILVFTTIGVWHGAEFKYIAYGWYQAVIIISGMLLEPYLKKLAELLRINTKSFGWKVFAIIRTFIIIVIGRFFSRALSFNAAIGMFISSFTWNPEVITSGAIFELGISRWDALILAVSLVIWFIISVFQERGVEIREAMAEKNVVVRWAFYLLAIAAVVIFGAYGSGYDGAEFIYREF